MLKAKDTIDRKKEKSHQQKIFREQQEREKASRIQELEMLLEDKKKQLHEASVRDKQNLE